ncbi:MAG TPA: hypothetical protein VHP33_04345 [Polyangiaceae bacterium]|nr:hypothetical protein [Polyangiaceae bacterium]
MLGASPARATAKEYRVGHFSDEFRASSRHATRLGLNVKDFENATSAPTP